MWTFRFSVRGTMSFIKGSLEQTIEMMALLIKHLILTAIFSCLKSFCLGEESGHIVDGFVFDVENRYNFYSLFVLHTGHISDGFVFDVENIYNFYSPFVLLADGLVASE